jgi:uncharacterized RDD family membrane protein YckC
MTPWGTRTREPAELERRFRAFVVDRVVAWGVVAAAAYLVLRHVVDPDRPVTGVVVVAALVLAVGAALAVPLGLTGSSPGRAAAGVRLLDARTGAPLGVGRAMRRQLVLGLATLPTFGIGVAVLAWTVATDPGGRRRGWHDRVVGSEVVDVRATRRVEDVAEDGAEDAGAPQLVNLTALRLAPVVSAVPDGSALARALRPRPGLPGAAVADVGRSGSNDGRWRVEFDTGESVLVDEPVLLGRDPEARPGETGHRLVPLRSADMSLSKTHAQVRLTADGLLVVTDRGSTNGSTLLRQGAVRELPVGRATTLLDGDRVRFGDREMRVRRDAGDRTPTTRARSSNR